MIEIKLDSSKFDKWEGDFEAAVDEDIEFWVHLALPLVLTNKENIYQLIFSWTIRFYLTKNQQEIFEAVYNTTFWVKFEKDKTTLDDLMELCEDSFSKLSIAYNNRIRTMNVLIPKMYPFNRETILKPVQSLYEERLPEYNLR